MLVDLNEKSDTLYIYTPAAERVNIKFIYK